MAETAFFTRLPQIDYFLLPTSRPVGINGAVCSDPMAAIWLQDLPRVWQTRFLVPFSENSCSLTDRGLLAQPQHTSFNTHTDTSPSSGLMYACMINEECRV